MKDLQQGKGKRGAEHDETAQYRVIGDRYIVEDYIAPCIVDCCHPSSPFAR
jgi:hypothetical protein